MKNQRLTGLSWTWTKLGLRLETGICSSSSGITSSTRSTPAWFPKNFTILCVAGDGGRETFLGHGSRDHQPQQARCRHPWQGPAFRFNPSLKTFFQVCLMSRDELNVLVVSYAELKNCLEQVKSKRWTSLLNIIIQSYGEVLASASTKPKHTGMHQVLSIF